MREGTVNRDKIEQEAMNLLRRGQTEKALEAYLSILRHDPRDRRVRQKVAELYLTLGRKPEAVRHLTDVARSLRAAGQMRAAVSIYKQLVGLKPDQHELRADLAECLTEVRRLPEARRAWEEAFSLVERRDPAKAIEYARAVSRLSPGELPPKVRVAELLEQNRRIDEAFDAWVELGREARRYGRPDDQARFLERALALQPDHIPTLLRTAEARIAQGDYRAALTHIQKAYTRDPRNVDLLILLGQALQGLGQVDKARKVWIQAARHLAETGDMERRVDALRHAIECGGDDPALLRELENADAEARRSRIRLHEMSWAAPRTDDEVRVIIAANTLADYGFPDRAREVLDRADSQVKAGVPWKVRHAELLIAQGDRDAGIEVLRSIQPESEEMAADLATRLEVLGHRPEPGASAAPPDEGEAEELVDDEPTDAGRQASASPPSGSPSIGTPPTPAVDIAVLEQEADRLADDGDVEGAIAAYRRILEVDPTNMEVLRKIGEVMSGRRHAARRPSAGAAPASAEEFSEPIALAIPEPSLETVDFGSAFSEVDPDAMASLDELLLDARALIEVGLHDEAQERLRGQDDLEALVVQAIAARGMGRLDGAQTRLERAIQGGTEHHPAYIEALWELAGVYLLRHKLGNAERMLDEVEALDAGYRPMEMAIRRRAIALLRQR
ncbi:MAG: hypothetical protein D6798_01870 [Deltaproteobacteria bacterium]|nr:MAG: hypothetical protein D6798_01870 [Deltaproteobacteria bacterium]